MTLQRAADELGAVNGALSHLGEGALISLTANRPAARYARAAFGSVRDALLRSYPWNFAHGTLTLTADPSLPAGSFPLAYPLPSTCLRVNSVEGATEDDWSCESVDVVVNGAAQTVNVLSTAIVAPRIHFNKPVAQVERWDPLFLEIFELKLAAKIAPLLGKDNASALDARAEQLMPRAQRVDAREASRKRIRPEVSYISARRV